jgi:hypothetical protein
MMREFVGHEALSPTKIGDLTTGMDYPPKTKAIDHGYCSTVIYL